MNNEKFTAGPWKAHIDLASSMVGDDMSIEEATANVNLIKHAPDLYNALKELIEFDLCDKSSQYGGLFRSEELEAAINNAQSILDSVNTL